MKETQGSRYVLNGDLIQSRSKQFVVDGTRFVYSNKNGAEVLSARGPLRKNMEIMVCILSNLSIGYENVSVHHLFYILKYILPMYNLFNCI